MAKHFVYPLSGQTTAYAIDSGSIPDGGGTYTSNASKVTSDERLTDNSITGAANFTAQHTTIRVDKGGAAIDAVDSVAFYSTAADSDGFRFYTNSATDSSTTTEQVTFAETLKGWNIVSTLTAGNSERYWYMSAHEGAVATVTEVIFGVKLDLTNIILGGTEGIDYGNDIIKTKGGNEFSIKQYGARRFWDLKLNHVTSSYKTTLESFKRSMDGSYYNFLYYDGSSYHYVYMDEASLSFKEIAFGVYKAKIKLIEVL